MIKLKYVVDNPGGACSFYRSLGVLPYLQELSISKLENDEWQNMIQADVIYIERPTTQYHLDVMSRAKKFGIPVWIDHDDNFFAIPNGHPHKEFYSRGDVLTGIFACLRMADLVTVTTPGIQEQYLGINPNVKIVKNAWNDYLFKEKTFNNQERLIMWRGSDTHREDLYSVLPALKETASKFGSRRWAFLGDGAYFYAREVANSAQLNTCSLIEYYDEAYKMAPSIMIAPLVDNESNQCKSNIAWLEGTLFGAVVLASPLPEFTKEDVPGLDDLEFYIMDLLEREKEWEKANENICLNYRLSDVNEERLNALKGILK